MKSQNSAPSPISLDQLRPAFHAAGYRLTPQRVAIADLILSAQGHPSVQELFEQVRGRFPMISLATVYHTLRTLMDLGLVQELAFQNGARYEPNTMPHANLVCLRCGTIIDAHDADASIQALEDAIAATQDFKITGRRFDLYGYCAACTVPNTSHPA